MITTPPRQALGQALVLTLFLATVTALPRQDESINVGSPILWTGQAFSSSEETDVSVQVEHQAFPSFLSQPDDEIHPFLDVDDLSAEYEYDYHRSNESDEDDDDERVRRSLMGRGSTARGGGRRGGGDISRRRDGNRNDYGGGSHYTWTSKRAPIPAPIVNKDNNVPSPVTTTSNAKTKKEKKKKKKSGLKKNKDRNGLTKPLRQEIAEYALQHGLVAAIDAYKTKVGRSLPEKVVDKWVQRLRKKQSKHSS